MSRHVFFPWGAVLGVVLVAGLAAANPIPVEPGPGGPEVREPTVVMSGEIIRITIARDGGHHWAWVDCDYFMSTQVIRSRAGSEVYLACPVPRDADCVQVLLFSPREDRPRLQRLPGFYETSVGRYDAIIWQAIPEKARSSAPEGATVRFTVRLMYRHQLVPFEDGVALVYPLSRSLQVARSYPGTPEARVLVALETGCTRVQVATSEGALPQRTFSANGITFLEASWRPVAGTPLAMSYG